MAGGLRATVVHSEWCGWRASGWGGRMVHSYVRDRRIVFPCCLHAVHRCSGAPLRGGYLSGIYVTEQESFSTCWQVQRLGGAWSRT